MREVYQTVIYDKNSQQKSNWGHKLLNRKFIVIIVLCVILAAIFFWYISLKENLPKDSNFGWVWKQNPENPGNYIGYHGAGCGTIYLEDCTIIATHNGSSDSMDLDVLAGESQIKIAGMTLDFVDLVPFGELGINDIFIIYGGETGDIIWLVYKPTSASVVGYTLP